MLDTNGKRTAARPESRVRWASSNAGMIANAETLIARFKDVAEVNHDRKALITNTESVNYGTLLRRAGQISSLLKSNGIVSPEPIALVFPQGTMMISAILGVIGAGAAYVPLRIADPIERWSAVLNEAKCRIVLFAPEFESVVEQLPGHLTRVSAAEAEGLEPSFAERTKDSISYILFTSGTTGTPKGVFQNDRNVLHHAACYADSIALTREDRMTLFSTYGFDASVMDIFGTLLTGACLCIWDVKESGFKGLEKWLSDLGVSIWHSTPSLLRAAFGYFDGKIPVRCVVFGGEGANGRDISLTDTRTHSYCQIINGFGPTECTTALQYCANREEDSVLDRLPIGVPVPGVTAVLIDENGDEKGGEGPGEIVVKSQFLALGYFNRADLTRGSFSEVSDTVRSYRTGDLGYRLPSGSLVHLGRIDDQIKIRGHRVEASEIEKALCLDNDVAESFVLFDNLGTSENILMAFIVLRNPEVSKNIRSLRNCLKSNLPDYMVPQKIVVVDSFPLTSNGKIDRNGLKEICSQQTHKVESNYRAPRTSIEKILTGMWQEALGIERIGIDDDFFEIGGDSLTGAILTARICESLDTDTDLRALFDAPTISHFANHLMQANQ